MIEIETEQGLRIRASSSAQSRVSGEKEKVLLYIRPEAIALTGTGEGSTRANRISGKVTASAYQGSFVEYEIDSRGKPIKANVINPKGKPLFQRGDEVAMVFDPEDVGLVRGQS